MGGVTHSKFHHDTEGFHDSYQRFAEEERVMLQTMFQDLARRSVSNQNQEVVEKETFLRVFKLPGMLGERLFAVFDSKKTGVVDFEEFIYGLSQIVRGSADEKVRFIFKMYDLNGDGQVSRSELTTMLNSVFSAASFVADQAYLEYTPETPDTTGEGVVDQESEDKTQMEDRRSSDLDNDIMREEFNIAVTNMIEHAFQLSNHKGHEALTVEDFKTFIELNPKLVQLLDHTFSLHSDDECESGSSDTDESDGTMSPRVKRKNGSVSRMMKSPSNSKLYKSNGHHSHHGGHHGGSHKHLFLDEIVTPISVKAQKHEDHQSFTVHCTSCGLHFTLSFCYRCGHPTKSADCEHCGRIFMGEGMRFCPSCGATSLLNPSQISSADVEVKKNPSSEDVLSVPQTPTKRMSSFEFASNGSNINVHASKRVGNVLDHFHPHHHHHAHMKGYLFKVGKKFHVLTERFYILRDDFVYSFKRFDDIKPRHVLWLEGCFVDKIDDPHNKNKKMNFGFEITVGADQSGSRVFYAATEQERDQWINAIRTASHSFDIKDFYNIGKEIGVGKFSSVRVATNKKSKKKYAVKVIDRKKLDKREREALRTEIAVLKLVNHPSIVHVKNVYETKDTIYIVMNLVEGGDLFDRIIKRRRFPEHISQSVIWKLLEVIKYLHDRGIVHRDLKPENIMVMDDEHDDDIVVGDFGLSKFTGPEELMQLPCGTLAYVAPEVLQGKGYGHEVDLWSVGIILYVLLRGRLPFDSKDKKTIIKMTMQGKLNFQSKYWAEISPEAKDLIRRLLDVNPRTRCGVEEAQNHPWFEDTHHHSDDEHKHSDHLSHSYGHNRFNIQHKHGNFVPPPMTAPHSQRHSFHFKRPSNGETEFSSLSSSQHSGDAAPDVLRASTVPGSIPPRPHSPSNVPPPATRSKTAAAQCTPSHAYSRSVELKNERCLSPGFQTHGSNAQKRKSVGPNQKSRVNGHVKSGSRSLTRPLVIEKVPVFGKARSASASSRDNQSTEQLELKSDPIQGRHNNTSSRKSKPGSQHPADSD